MRAWERYRFTPDTECLRRNLLEANTTLFAFSIPGKGGCIPLYRGGGGKDEGRGEFLYKKSFRREGGVEIFRRH